MWVWWRRNQLILLDFDTHLLRVQQVEAIVDQKTVEKEMDRYGAEVPHSMSVEDPQHWGEVEQL